MLGVAMLMVSGLPSGGRALKVVETSDSVGTDANAVAAKNGPAGDQTGTAALGGTRSAQLGSGQPVTLAFGGDVHFEGVLASRLAANPATFLSVARPLYARTDLMMINLETAITSRGSAQPKQYLFRAPASALTAMKAAGITVATEANNHGEDYGPVGLADSIEDARESGLAVIGIGENADQAFAPYLATIKGQRVAIIAATQVLDDNLRDAWTATDTHPGLASAYDPTRLLAAVRQARATSDTVVVYLHWGVETQTCPTTTQEQLADQVVAAGADVVVGSHAHVQLGAGYLNGAFVDYGLGNFAFYAALPAQVESGVLQVTVTGRRIDRYEWLPARLSGGVARPLTGSAATAAQAQWAGLRSCTDLTS
jgi:poly-gamma-glutamate synthesis protein (capsule biosynthesis protein)